jgi:hypothetical protein
LKIYINLLILFLLISEASAYIDPGTGSILFQFIIAGFIGFVYLIRNKIRGLFDFLVIKSVKKKAKRGHRD